MRPRTTLIAALLGFLVPVAGLMGNLMFHPLIGDLYKFFNFIGWDFDHKLDAFDAGFVVVLISVWKQVSVNFIFFLSGRQGIPNSVIEALACGLPVVSFDTGALPELVTPGAGRVVAYGGDPWRLDPRLLAEVP